jgi:DNA-binding FadR family transcriptional regulator
LARERDPYGWALCNVRRKLKAGDYAGGDPLTITDLARELRLSPTPVREALAHLAGEGLVEDRRGRGYYVWRLDAPDLIELYDLHALFVGAALAAVAAPSGTIDNAEATVLGDPADAVFWSLVEASGARTLMSLFRAVATRLGPVHAVEAQALGDLAQEAAALAQALEARRWTTLAEEIAAYHDRRRSKASDLAAILRKTSQRRHNIHEI